MKRKLLFMLILLYSIGGTTLYARNVASTKMDVSAVPINTPTPTPPQPPTPPTPPQPPSPPTPPQPPTPPAPNPHPTHQPRPPRPHHLAQPAWGGTTVFISTGSTYTDTQWAYQLYPAQKKLTGKGVKIAIADSGISSHVEFNGKNIQTADFTHSSGTHDSKNHGTAVVGVIGARGVEVTGVAPDAQLIVYKIDDGSRLISPQAATSAINALLDYNEKHPNDKIAVLNLSYGVSGGTDTALTKAINRAYDAGVFIVCPAGNSGFSGVYYPANLSTTVAVGAMSQDQTHVTSHSSYGKEVDFVAPGEQVYTTSSNGRYTTVDGTSVAAAFVSASAALVVEGFKNKYGRYPTVEEIKAYLIKAAVELPNVSRDKQGYGFIDVKRLEEEFL